MPAPPSCFVALPLRPCPPLLDLQDRLPDVLRPIHPEDLHVTVAYFGRIPRARHEGILALVASMPREPFEVTLDGLLALPARRRPTATTLRLGEGHDAVAALMSAWRPRLVAAAGVEAETRGPLPHVTFARPRGRRMTEEKRAAVLAWIDATPELGAHATLGAPALFRSRPPREGGPHYEIVRPG